MNNQNILENIDKTIALLGERNELKISPFFFEKIQLKLEEKRKTSFQQFDFDFLKLAFISLFWIATLFTFLQIKNSVTFQVTSNDVFLKQVSEAYYLNSDSYFQLTNQ